MIFTKFILPALLGVGSIATVSGIVYSNKQQSVKETSNSHYVIAYSKNMPEDHKKINLEDYTCVPENLDKTNISNKKDDACKAYLITFNDTKNIIKASDLIANKTIIPATNTNEFTYGKFLLLKVAVSLYDDWKLNGTETIELLPKDKKNQKYATFGIYGKINENKLIGTHNWIIVKNIASDNALSTFTGITGYTCNVEDSQDPQKDCSIREIKNSLNAEFNFSSFATNFLPAETSITSNNYYMINLKDHSLKTEDLKNKNIIFTQTSTNKTAKFEVISPVWASFAINPKSVILA